MPLGRPAFYCPIQAAAPPIVYSTWDPTQKTPGSVLSNGNLTIQSNNYLVVLGTRGYPANGTQDLYFEVTFNTGADNECLIGLGISPVGGSYPGQTTGSIAYWGYNGNLFVGPGGAPGNPYGVGYAPGDTVGVRLTNGRLSFSKNGSSQGAAYNIGAALGSALVYPEGGCSNSTPPFIETLNVGATPFLGLPSGASAWT